MREVAIAIRVIVAAMFAALCVLGHLAGCLAVLVIGVISLATLKPATTEGDSLQAPNLRQFSPWILCVLLFGFFVLVFAPFAVLPAVIMALLILSPFFGTMVLLASSAIGDLTNHLT